jgi:hypothetical protein
MKRSGFREGGTNEQQEGLDDSGLGGQGLELGMTDILLIVCKDCGSKFTYSAEAADADRRVGRTPPERCASCRVKHREVNGERHSGKEVK